MDVVEPITGLKGGDMKSPLKFEGGFVEPITGLKDK